MHVWEIEMQRYSPNIFQIVVSILVVALIAMIGSAAAQQKSSDSIVRSATLTTSGEISGDFRPLDIAEAKLQGACNDDAFANFGIIYETDDWRKVSVTIMTDDGIAADQLGPVKLDWALVSFTDSAYDATQFRGPAEFVITKHDKGSPLLAGTVKGTLPAYGGMLGSATLSEKPIDFEFTFEVAASCGAAM